MTFNTYTLGELVSIKYGKNQKKVLSDTGTVPIYGTGGLMGYATEALYNKPSVLIGRKGTIEKIRYVDHSFWTVDTLFYTIVNEEIVIPQFLYYTMLQLDLLQYNEGTTIPSLRTETLNRIELQIPDIESQKEILRYLATIDDKIVLNAAINENLEQQAQALFEKIIVSNSDKANGVIGDYCTVKSGFAFKSSWWTEKGVKVIKIKNIDDGRINLNDCSFVSYDKIEKAKDFLVSAGDVLIAMTGATLGKFAIVPRTKEQLLVNQRVGKFFLGDNSVDKLPFLYCTLKQTEIITEIINRGQGSAQANISAADILSVPCFIPKIEFITQFNAVCKPIFESLITNQEENQHLSELQDILLPKLMNGEIDGIRSKDLSC